MAFLWQVLTLAELDGQGMIPNRVPRGGQEVAERLIIGLAGKHIAVGFDAHAVERGGAAFDSEVAGGGVELVVLSRRVPDEFLSACGGLLCCHIEDGL